MNESQKSQSNPEDFESFLRDLPSQQPMSDDIAIRLAHARARAVSHAKRPLRWLQWSGLAASVAIAALIGLHYQSITPAHHQKGVELMADLDFLADENDQELINELEFYQWLSAMEAG